jgi:amino acid transporter
MMAFVLQYWPPILAGTLFALILIVFMVSSLRAYRRRTTPPRAIRTTVVLAATACSLALFEMCFRVPPGDGEMFWKDMMVALGTMLVVWLAVVVALTYLHGRSTPPMTETEREAWLERSTGDLDVLAKFFVGMHALTLTYGAFVLVAFLLMALIWTLVR